MNIFVLTGAGVSAESGLGTFRDKAGTGIWAEFDPMKLATPEAFEADPEEVQRPHLRRAALRPRKRGSARLGRGGAELTRTQVRNADPRRGAFRCRRNRGP